MSVFLKVHNHDKVNLSVTKLDGICPNDNSPSKQIASTFCIKKVNLSCDFWHVTGDIWHMTHDMWEKGSLLSNVSSLALTVWDWRYFKDIFTENDLVTNITNEFKGVCKNSPGYTRSVNYLYIGKKSISKYVKHTKVWTIWNIIFKNLKKVTNIPNVTGKNQFSS